MNQQLLVIDEKPLASSSAAQRLGGRRGRAGGLPIELYQKYDNLINPIVIPQIKPF
jgi:hypothetical protein